MPRRSRDHADGYWYHVFNRGARRWPIFRNDTDRRAFLALLRAVHEDHGAEIHAYCLMDNHYHLVLRCPHGNLAAAMQHLGQRYTQQFNHHHGVDGPLFRGRFGSKPIGGDDQLLITVRYVARNPLDIGDGTALDRYPWSSHRAHLGIDPPPEWLDTALVLTMFGGPGAYRRFVEQPHPADRQVLDVSVASVEQAVLTITGSVANTLTDATPGTANEPRLLLVLGAIELTSSSPADLVGSYGLDHAGSVRSTLHRARRRRETVPAFALLWNRLVAALGRPEHGTRRAA